MSKYYTPTFDEFHKGLRFEVVIDNEYNEGTFDPELKDLHLDQCRIKYLDIDDIKELGFTLKNENDDYTVLYKNVMGPQPFYYTLIFRQENGLPFVEIHDMYNHPIMAKVHIKNIDELEWLLNRYGIL